MKLLIGQALHKHPQTGIPEYVDVAFDLSKSPYKDSGFTAMFLGNQGSGKSNFAAVMAEEFNNHKIPTFYFDNGASAFGLTELGNHVVTVGNENHPDEKLRAMRPIEKYFNLMAARTLVQSVLLKGYSVVVDCSIDPERHDLTGKLDKDSGYCEHPLFAFLNIMRMLYQQAQILKRPCFVVIDEAQFFAPENNVRTIPIQKATTDAMAFISHDSRKAGIASLILGQRSTYVNKRILFGPNVKIFGIHNSPDDFRKIKAHCPDLTHADLKGLTTGKAYLAGAKNTSFIEINERITPAYGGTPVFKSHIDELPDHTKDNFDEIIKADEDPAKAQAQDTTQAQPAQGDTSQVGPVFSDSEELAAPEVIQGTLIPEITITNPNGSTANMPQVNGANAGQWERI